MEQNIVIILILAVSAVAVTNAADDTLLSVVQVFRHGERTPILFYPTDPYKNSSYWNELTTGQLTDNGKTQLVELGKYFRDRYGDFLSASYSENEIYVTSVNTKRNLLSAESFLQGVYPNEDTSSVTIHQTPTAVMGGLAECIRYDLLYLELELQNEYFKRINEENSEIYKIVGDNADFPVFELVTAHTVWDTLNIEDRFNYTLPEWTNSVFPEKLTNLSDLFALSLCYTDEQQRLMAGPFINQLTQHFETVLSDASSAEKVRLYSGHDDNIACLLNALRAFNSPHVPDFASSLIFELRRLNGTNYVNAYYKPDGEAIPITLRECDFNCSFEDFKSIFGDMVLTEAEWAVKCFTPL